jgi:hypothetical protein
MKENELEDTTPMDGEYTSFYFRWYVARHVDPHG